MPYFQRDQATGAPLPIAVAIDRSAAPAATTATTATSIVEKARAIIDGAVGDAATPEPPPGGLGGLAPSLPDLPGLADVHGRLAEALVDLLKLYAPPQQAGPATPATTAVRALSGSLSTVPLVQSEGSVGAGSTATIPLSLINEGAAVAVLVLYSTDFICDNGHEIPAVQATFSPRALSLASRSRGSSTMHVAVPPQTPPGNYSALVQATGLALPCAVVMLRID